MINIKLIYIYVVNINIFSKLCDFYFDWFSVYWCMYWIINDNIEFWFEYWKLILVYNVDFNVVLIMLVSWCLLFLFEVFFDVVV